MKNWNYISFTCCDGCDTFFMISSVSHTGWQSYMLCWDSSSPSFSDFSPRRLWVNSRTHTEHSRPMQRHTVLVYTLYDIPPCWMQVAGLFTHIYHTHYDYWLLRTARNSLHYVTYSAIFLNGSDSLLRTNNAANYIPYLSYIYIYYSLFCQLLVLIGFWLTLSL